MWPADPDTESWLLSPRDDVVRERRDGAGSGDARFVQDEGPFRRYERQLTLGQDAAGAATWHERTTFSLHIPWFGWLFRRPLVGMLRRRAPGRGDHGRQPWWAPPQRLSPRQVLVLGLLAAASLSATFVNTLFTQTVAFAADEFEVSEGTQGIAAAVVRMGIILALPLTVLADRAGRRRMILVAAWTAPVVASLGAIAPTFPILTATQAVGRPLGLALDILVAVVAVEEMPRGARAYAVSVLAMASGLGAGVAVAALPLADLSVTSWRLVYVVALIWLAVAVDLTRRLPETHRYTAVAEAPPELRRSALDRRRFALLATVALLTNLFVASASLFQNRFLKEDRGYSASTIALFTLATATPAAVGLVIGGRMADRRGRRYLAAVAMPLGSLVLAGSFGLFGPALWFGAFLGGFISTIAYPAIAVYRRELFPTANRGRANGLLVALGLLGGSVGLVITGALIDAGWSYVSVMSLLASFSVLAGLLIALFYPETASRELEEINVHDASVQAAHVRTAEGRSAESPHPALDP